MKIVEDEVGLDPEGNVDGGDDHKKVSGRLEFSSEPCALQKADLNNLEVYLKRFRFDWLTWRKAATMVSRFKPKKIDSSLSLS